MTRSVWVLGALLVLILLGMLGGVALGPARLGMGSVLEALLSDGNSTAEVVVWDLRLPRVTAGLLVGACLGASGALLQISTRNPLGDPQLFGVGGGAVIVQALALAGTVRMGPWGLVSLSVAASLAGTSVIAFFASREDLTPARLALIGVSFGALCAAVATGIMAEAQVFSQQSIALIGGSLSARGWRDILPALPYLMLGMALAVAFAGRLNLLAIGDRITMNLGSDPRRTRAGAMASAGVLGGAAVAVAGLVGFVGLLVPHVARALVGHDSRAIIFISVPLGAAITLYADQVARLAFMPSEVPVGLVTSALGAPLMVYVARRVL